MATITTLAEAMLAEGVPEAEVGFAVEEARGWLIDCGMSITRAYRLDDAAVVRIIERHAEGGFAGFVEALNL